jgi:hypothetical protein
MKCGSSGIFSQNKYPDSRRKKVEYTHTNVIPAATSFPQQRQFRAKGGNPGRVTVHGETISETGKSLEDKVEDNMDGAGQSRVERSLRRDPRLDSIQSSGTVWSVFLRDQLIRGFLCVFMVGCEPTAHGSLRNEPEMRQTVCGLC